MLLRRVTQHVRDQNWTAVVIDFAIVVIGVFVGIQVANWNDARLDRIYERQMMTNLHEEFRITVDEGKQLLNLLNLAKESTGRIIDAIRSGHEPDDEEGFLLDLYRANWIFDAPTGSTTYSELVATGGISKLHDKEIRDSLHRYMQNSRQYEGTLQLAREFTLSPESTYLSAVQWSTDTSTWDSPKAILSYDWDSLRLAQGELQSWQAVQDNMSNWYSLVVEAANDVLRVTGELR